MARGRVTAGFVLALAGCGGAGGPGSDGEAVGSSSTSSTSGSGSVSPDAFTTTTGRGDDPGNPDEGVFEEGTLGPGDSSGSVEETFFGMSDDMPLVADIPSIKRGDIPARLEVRLEQVRPTTRRAELGRAAWIYVQDPAATEHMGLRVLLQTSDPDPTEGRVLDLEGWVLQDAQGWLLELDTMVEGSEQPPVEPVELRVAELRSPAARIYDDALVEVVDSSALVVTRRGPVIGTVLVASPADPRAAVLVDLRPFDIGLDLPPGTHLSLLRGVAEIDDGRPVLLPRDASDLVVAR